MARYHALEDTSVARPADIAFQGDRLTFSLTQRHSGRIKYSLTPTK